MRGEREVRACSLIEPCIADRRNLPLLPEPVRPFQHRVILCTRRHLLAERALTRSSRAEIAALPRVLGRPFATGRKERHHLLYPEENSNRGFLIEMAIGACYAAKLKTLRCNTYGLIP